MQTEPDRELERYKMFAELESQWAEGIRTKDHAALERILADDYALYLSPSPSEPVSRAEWLAMLGVYNVRSYAFLDIEVRAFGEVVAVSSLYTQEADVAGEDRSGDFFLVDIWVNRNGKWQVAARYSGRAESKLPSRMQSRQA